MSELGVEILIRFLQANGSSAPYIAGYLSGLVPTAPNPYQVGTWQYTDWANGYAEAGRSRASEVIPA
jgi:hypothetical protein